MADRDRAAASAARHALAGLTGREHVILTGRAAAGIYALLRALELRDRWIALPANTCYIVMWAVLRSGNHPLLVDVDPETGNLEPDGLAQCSEHPAVLIVPHLYGRPASMRAVMAWAAAQNTFVIEDCAQAAGNRCDDRPVGGWGDAAVFSFGSGKIVDHAGGGAVICDDADLARSVRGVLMTLPIVDSTLDSLIAQWDALYWSLHQFEDINPRLCALYRELFAIYGDITAYLLPLPHWHGLPSKLATLRQNIEKRMQQAALYDQLLSGLPGITTTPHAFAPWRYSVCVRPSQRRAVLQYLWTEGFADVTRWYPCLRWMLSALSPQQPVPVTPNADALAARVLNLPVGEQVTEGYIRRLCTALRTFMDSPPFEQSA